MLHLGCRQKVTNKKNERYTIEKEEEPKPSYEKTPFKINSSKILPNRSVKLKPIQNSSKNLNKVRKSY